MEKIRSEWRWWLVALLPRPLASWLFWDSDVELGDWAPYVLGQALGCRGSPLTDVDGPFPPGP